MDIGKRCLILVPIASMYGVFTYIYYIWLIFMVHVGKYSICGCYGMIIHNFGAYSFQLFEIM